MLEGEGEGEERGEYDAGGRYRGGKGSGNKFAPFQLSELSISGA